jgi:putative alpha-1,2-mannosidase
MLLHPPRFDRVEIDLANGRQLVVQANGASTQRPQYIAGASFDGQPQTAVWLDVDRLRQGGILEYDLSAAPDSTGWGTQEKDAPPAACPTP